MKGTETTGGKAQFVKKMQEVAGFGNLRELWSDWVMMLAICISNVNDFQQEREDMFFGLKRKYKPDQIQGMSELTGMYFDLAEENPFQDLLGDLYMRLEMGNSNTGQFFTPYHLAKLLARMYEPEAYMKAIVEKGWCSFSDPACGGGALLIAGAERMLEDGINYQKHCLFIGQELGITTACSAYVQLSTLGMPGAIICGDTLRDPFTGRLPIIDSDSRTWITPLYYDANWKSIRLCYVFEEMMARGRKN